jgi:hypothetical protein
MVTPKAQCGLGRKHLGTTRFVSTKAEELKIGREASEAEFGSEWRGCAALRGNAANLTKPELVEELIRGTQCK